MTPEGVTFLEVRSKVIYRMKAAKPRGGPQQKGDGKLAKSL